MEDASKKLHNTSKKIINMKGCRMPRIFITGLGWLHSKCGVINLSDGRVTSPYTERKQKDFDSYTAELYKVTAHILKDLRVARCEVQDRLLLLDDELEILKSQLSPKPPETTREKRKNASLRCQIKEVSEKRRQTAQKLKEIKINIEDSEHETEELIHATKSRAEALLLAYFEGAKVVGGQESLLQQDKIAVGLYRQYCGKFTYQIGTEREDGDDVK